ncbi:SpaA isopeptide-forming pilin-related protein, partial [Dolosicoccus paucivorans]
MYKSNLLKKAMLGAVVTMPLTASMLQVSAESGEDITDVGSGTITESDEMMSLQSSSEQIEESSKAEEPSQKEEYAGHGSVQIRVVDNGFKPVVGATVELLNSKGEGRQVKTDESGNANFTDVPAGESYTAALALVPEGYEYNAFRTPEITVENTGDYEDFITVDRVQTSSEQTEESSKESMSEAESAKESVSEAESSKESVSEAESSKESGSEPESSKESGSEAESSKESGSEPESSKESGSE